MSSQGLRNLIEELKAELNRKAKEHREELNANVPLILQLDNENLRLGMGKELDSLRRIYGNRPDFDLVIDRAFEEARNHIVKKRNVKLFVNFAQLMQKYDPNTPSNSYLSETQALVIGGKSGFFSRAKEYMQEFKSALKKELLKTFSRQALTSNFSLSAIHLGHLYGGDASYFGEGSTPAVARLNSIQDKVTQIRDLAKAEGKTNIFTSMSKVVSRIGITKDTLEENDRHTFKIDIASYANTNATSRGFTKAIFINLQGKSLNLTKKEGSILKELVQTTCLSFFTDPKRGIFIARDLQTSKPTSKIVEETFRTALTKKNKNYSYSSNATAKTTLSVQRKTPKVKPKVIKPDVRGVTPPYRNLLTGRFTSLRQIQGEINLRLHNKIKQNMGEPSLVYRTGRFAKSAEVMNISRGKSGLLTVQYTYRKQPYAIFEPGNPLNIIDKNAWAPASVLATAARDPKLIIGLSIRELMAERVAEKLRLVRV